MLKRLVKAIKARWADAFSYASSVVLSQRGAIGADTIKIGIFAAIAFVIVGIAANFIPVMMQGFNAAYNAPNATLFTGFQTVVGMGPTLIVLGFIIAIAVVAFLGIKVGGGGKDE